MPYRKILLLFHDCKPTHSPEEDTVIQWTYSREIEGDVTHSGISCAITEYRFY